MSTARSKTVQSVDRAVMLLRTLTEADRSMTVAELAERCDLERPTAWRLLWTLESNGLIEKVEAGNAYRVSIGWLYQSPRLTLDALVRTARPVLSHLATQQRVTASLVQVQRFTIEYVDQVDGDLFTSPRWEGQALSLHASSPGKAVLASLPEPEWRGMVGPSLSKLTPTTITAMRAFKRELNDVRDRGYATCRGEDVTYSNGASAVITVGGHTIGAVDLWGPDRVVPIERLEDLGQAAAGGAQRIATLLTPRQVAP